MRTHSMDEIANLDQFTFYYVFLLAKKNAALFTEWNLKTNARLLQIRITMYENLVARLAIRSALRRRLNKMDDDLDIILHVQDDPH